ncbi:MAG TPA: zf-HC2 domain-containing protein [Acidobacteriaceae bacterium]|nr:zf-HC2 domain-containing protein [Acidobacteriaceae bacterium]
MDHNQAIRTMAVERYLLNELTPEDREAFEIHFFSCSECSYDLRAAAAFMHEAKAQLPEFATSSYVHPQHAIPTAESRPQTTAWWRPALIIPAFLALLAIVAYQSLVTAKAMRSVSTQPRFVPRVLLQAGDPASAQATVAATRGRGVVLLIDLPRPDLTYKSYSVDLKYPESSRTWTETICAAAATGNPSEPLSLFIPAAGLQQGPYHFSIYGITPQGRRALLDQSTLDVKFKSRPAHS